MKKLLTALLILSTTACATPVLAVDQGQYVTHKQWEEVNTAFMCRYITDNGAFESVAYMLAGKHNLTTQQLTQADAYARIAVAHMEVNAGRVYEDTKQICLSSL